MKLLLAILASVCLHGATYTVNSPFLSTGVTATGALGGSVTIAGGAFDGATAITVQISDGWHTAAGSVRPPAGATSALWSLTVPNSTGPYTLSSTHSGAAVSDDPGAQAITVSPVLQLATNQANYRALACGNFFHFNMSTFGDFPNQWATPNIPVDTFAPTSSSIPFGSWMANVKAWGCNYATLTAKHLDGFKLWNSASRVGNNVAYGVNSTLWSLKNGQPDLVSQFVIAARAASVTPVLYFSIADRTYEVQSNSNAATNTAAYRSMIEAELTELLTYYGQIAAIWTDSWGWTPSPGAPGAGPAVGGHDYITVADVSGMIHRLQPNCLLLENDHAVPGAGDMTVYEVPIDGFPASAATKPAETADTIMFGAKWFWAPDSGNASSIQSARGLSANVPRLGALNSNYLLNVSPDRSGSVPAQQTAVLASLQEEAPYTNDLATAGSFSVSSTYPGQSANLMNDGEYGAHPGKFWSSNAEASPWAELDLGSDKIISRVELLNRNDLPAPDCCGGLFRDLRVTICSDAEGPGCVAPVYTSPVLNPLNVMYSQGDYRNGPGQLTLSLAASGRYVRVRRDNSTTTNGYTSLSLNEILVFPPSVLKCQQ